MVLIRPFPWGTSPPSDRVQDHSHQDERGYLHSLAESSSSSSANERGNCMTICLVLIADTLILGGYSWYPIVSMIIGATLIAIARVRHATLLHLWFQFLLCCSSWLKTLLTQLSSHTSGLLSTQTEFSHYSHTAGSMCPFVNSKPYRICGIISSIAIYSATRGIPMN